MLREDGPSALAIKLNSGRRLTAPFESEVARYVFACTAVTDRLLVTWYAPELHYGSGRGFAAGRPYFLTSFAPSAGAQAFSLAQLRRERVPIVLTRGAYETEFARPFPTFDEYLREHYRRVGVVGPNDDAVTVLADERLQPTSTYGDARLPCFR